MRCQLGSPKRAVTLPLHCVSLITSAFCYPCVPALAFYCHFLARPISPEDRARENIDRLLTGAGWIVQSRNETNLSAGRGIAIREFPLKTGYREADYLLCVDGVPTGVVEAKKEGTTVTGYEIQAEKYSVGLPPELKPAREPLPFCYPSTAVETRFGNLLEPEARSPQPSSFLLRSS